MGRVSICQKNCNTIDLRRAQVNKRSHWGRGTDYGGVVLVWIATNQTVGTNVKQICVVIVKKICHVTGTSAFPSASPTFPSVDCKYTNWAL